MGNGNMTSTDLPGTAEGFPVDPGACEQNEAVLGALERSSVSDVLKEQIRTVLETSRPCAVKGAFCAAEAMYPVVFQLCPAVLVERWAQFSSNS